MLFVSSTLLLFRPFGWYALTFILVDFYTITLILLYSFNQWLHSVSSTLRLFGSLDSLTNTVLLFESYSNYSQLLLFYSYTLWLLYSLTLLNFYSFTLILLDSSAVWLLSQKISYMLKLFLWLLCSSDFLTRILLYSVIIWLILFGYLDSLTNTLLLFDSYTHWLFYSLTMILFFYSHFLYLLPFDAFAN